MSDLRSQHLQVDLLTIRYVSAVLTQGAVTENSWVSSYLVHYSLDGNDWIVLTDEGGEIKVCFFNSSYFAKVALMDDLRWPNAVFARAFADAIQCVLKDLKKQTYFQ